MTEANFTDLSEYLLVALYQEPSAVRDLIELPPLIAKYGIRARNGLLSAVHQDLKRLGYIAGPDPIGGDQTAIAQLTGAGLRYVERKYSSKDGVGTILDQVEAIPAISRIDSTRWTGRIDYSDANAVRVRTILEEAKKEIEQSALSNSEISNAKAHIEAAQTLIEAPDPPWSIIVQFSVRQSWPI